MKIRKTVGSDLDKVQWGPTNWPPEDLIRNEIKDENSYVCINWAFEQCGHLRMDTHTDNVIMQNLLKKMGFIKCGIIYVVEDDYPRYAYERIR